MLPMPSQRAAPSNDLYRLYAVLCGLLGLVPVWILWLFASSALQSREEVRAYREQAIASVATVERLEAQTRQVGRESVTHVAVIVRFQDQGRTVTAPLRAHPRVAAEDADAWMAKDVPILHFAGRPDSAVMQGYAELLSTERDMLQLMPFAALTALACAYLAVSLWRKGRPAPSTI